MEPAKLVTIDRSVTDAFPSVPWHCCEYCRDSVPGTYSPHKSRNKSP